MRAEFLSQVSLFATLEPFELDRLVEQMTWVSVAAGNYLFRRGEPGDALYVTETGILDAVIDEGAASERTLTTFLPGEFFGEMALLTQEPRSASVRALVDSRLGRISCDQFIGLLKTHPEMGLRLSLVLSQSLARTNSQLSKRKGWVTTIIPMGDQQQSDRVAEQLLEFMERQYHRSVVIVLLGDAVLSSHNEQGADSSPPGWDSLQPMPRGGHSLRIDGTALEAMDLSSLAAMIHTLRTRHDHVVIWAPPQHALKRLELLTHFDQTLILACHPHAPEELTRSCVALQAVLKEAFRIAFLAPGHVPLPTLPCPTRYPPLKLNTPPVGNSNESRESPGPDGVMGAQHDSMDRLARTLSGLTIGLALGSGTAQGLAHLGVMKALISAGIPIDLIAGTSGGALYGSLMASGLAIDDAISRVMHQTRRNLIDKLDFTIPLRGVVRGKKIEKMVRNVIGDITFAELSIPLFAIATDLETGEEVVIQDGPVYQGVRASISVPGIFEPYPMNGRILRQTQPIRHHVHDRTLPPVRCGSACRARAGRGGRVDQARGRTLWLARISSRSTDHRGRFSGRAGSDPGHRGVDSKQEVGADDTVAMCPWRLAHARGQSAQHVGKQIFHRS